MEYVGALTTPKAHRILDATRELMLRRGSRGVTISEVARLAHVGKGTVYLYWATKEELIVELFIHDFLGNIDEIMENLAATPGKVAPRELFPLMHRTTRKHPFLVAIQARDNELLGYVEGHPSIRTLMNTLGPGALLAQIFPELRDHGLVRKDLALEPQIYGALALLEGFMQLPHAYPYDIDLRGADVDPDAVLGEVARLLFEPGEPASASATAAAADGVLACMKSAHRVAVDALSAANRRKRTGTAAAAAE